MRSASTKGWLDVGMKNSGVPDETSMPSSSQRAAIIVISSQDR
jgi:hypothetical protein